MFLKIAFLSFVITIAGSSAKAQILSLDTCLQIFAADSASLNKLINDQDFHTEDLSGNGLFVKLFKSKTDKSVSMMKVITTGTTRKQLVYHFIRNEQYSLLRNELQTGKFQHVESTKPIIEGNINIKDTYCNGDTLITLRREENNEAPVRRPSLFIRTF